MLAVRIVGGLLLVLGVLLVLDPGLLGMEPVTGDVFAAVERRIPGGGVAGIGTVMLTWQPGAGRLAHLTGAVLWLCMGLLMARFYGIVVDGVHPRQWMWVAVEAAIVAVAAAGLWWARDRQGGAAPEA